MTVAAPQRMGMRSARPTMAAVTPNINQMQVVTNLVSELQPSIAEAVGRALAGLQASTFTSISSQSSSSPAVKSGRKHDVSANTTTAKNAAVEPAVSAKVVHSDKPVYSYEYQVSDNNTQTYITKYERRDGELVTGTYSYVDPYGALITVNYEAGPMGYTQTLDKQEGYISIKSKPSKVLMNISSASSNSISSSLDQADLINQIISALQPTISSAVESALSSTGTFAVEIETT